MAREGDQAVGMPVGTRYYEFLDWFALSNAGQTALSPLTVGSTYTAGIWSEGSGGLALLAQNGDPAPNTSPGVTLISPNYLRPFDPPVLNTAGQTAFRARLAGTGVDNSNNSGILLGTPGDLKLMFRAGSQSPGVSSGVQFAGLGVPALNESGRIAFIAGLTGSDVNSSNDTGIWSGGSGNLALVARKGDQAPGLPAGVTFVYFPGSPDLLPVPLLNNVGQTAFYASLSGGGFSGSSVWSEGSGNLAVVAYRGAQAPGTPDGVTFAGFDLRSLVLNDAGQTAFVASLTGSSVNDTNDLGIWATDRNSVLQLIAREGELLEVAPGDFRTVYSFDFIGGTGNSDGRASGFNNRGQLAFHARFTDGSRGIFVSNLVAVPEPSSLLSFVLALFGGFVRRTRWPKLGRRMPLLLLSSSAPCSRGH